MSFVDLNLSSDLYLEYLSAGKWEVRMIGLELIGVFGYVGVFLVALAFNLIPFTSPSNMVLAGVIILTPNCNNPDSPVSG